MAKTYFLKLAKADTEELVALTFGTLAQVTFTARQHVVELTGSTDEYLLRLTEVSRIGGVDGTAETLRTLASIAADGDTVAGALKRKLANEKNVAASAPASTGE